jgi:hypothetical protein
VIELLDERFPDDPTARAAWTRAAALAGHVTVAVDHARYYRATGGRAITLAARHSSYLRAGEADGTTPATPVTAVSWLRAAVEHPLEVLLRWHERRWAWGTP